MIAESFAAMGTTVIVVAANTNAVAATRSLFRDVENRCSRFDPDSELSRLNRCPNDRVAASAELAAVMGTAARLARLTNGLVDPAVGASVIDWGYDRTIEEMIAPAVAPEPRKVLPWRVEGTEIVRPPGLLLDLGGIAKGWACDRAVELGLAALVSAGGDMRSATAAGIAEILDPWGHEVAAKVAVGIGALATSSVAKRRWQVGGEPAHHIIDPRTGRPAESPIVSASVTAATAAEAEAGAKAVMLNGASGLAWADSQPWITGALACWNDGAVYATGSLEMAA